VIAQAELYPIVLCRFIFKDRMAGRRVLYFIDNDSARDCLIKAFSPSVASNNLVQLFFNSDAASVHYPWFARVPSKSNVSDEPSRGEAASAAKRLGAQLLPWLDPPRQLVEHAMAHRSAKLVGKRKDTN